MLIRTEATQADAALADALLRGFAESGAALCLCDAGDLIRHANAPFRDAFCPQFDGTPADFTDTIACASRAGAGIKVTSVSLEDFSRSCRRARRDLVGSRRFFADLVDGSWWSILDTKLSNGWTLAVAQEVTGMKREEARLRDAHHSAVAEANTDHLTGAPNRRHGLRQAEALWRAARAANHGLSVALLDVDHFKAINDVYGHDAGDRALVHFAGAMMAAISPGDQFSRIGGDEFLLLRPGAGAQALEAALARIVAGLPPLTFNWMSERLRLSVSIGVAGSQADDTWPTLMHRADVALYGAKAGGRNRIARAG